MKIKGWVLLLPVLVIAAANCKKKTEIMAHAGESLNMKLVSEKTEVYKSVDLSEVLANVEADQKVTVLEMIEPTGPDKQVIGKIRLEDGREGFLMATFLKEPAGQIESEQGKAEGGQTGGI